MSVQVSKVAHVLVDVKVKVTKVGAAIDGQGQRELQFTESEAISLMYALADANDFDLVPRV
jgi:hypothetical protein